VVAVTVAVASDADVVAVTVAVASDVVAVTSSTQGQ